jgi:uncharacterized protein with PQ loop repeat
MSFTYSSTEQRLGITKFKENGRISVAEVSISNVADRSWLIFNVIGDIASVS